MAERPHIKPTAKSRLRIRVSPADLREAADRLEHELKNNTLKNQEAELEFSQSVIFYAEPAPERKVYTTFTSDTPGRPIKGDAKIAPLHPSTTMVS